MKPGKLADLIVVDGNPLEDLSALEEVKVVVQGGEVVARQSEPDSAAGGAGSIPTASGL